jgi:N utilization substance protein A
MNKEILQLVKALANEKNVHEEIVFQALEFALASAIKKYYQDLLNVRPEFDFIRLDIDRHSGQQTAYKLYRIVADEDSTGKNPFETPLSLVDGATNDDIGSFYEEEIENIDIGEVGRIGIITARQVITQKIIQAEEETMIDEMLDNGQYLFTGVIRRKEKNEFILEAGRLKAVLPFSNLLPNEMARLQVGRTTLRAYIEKVEKFPNRSPKITLSRTHVEFTKELFKLQVLELQNQTIEIKKIARDVGSRAKIAVVSHDEKLDPIGCCVGIRGSRIMAVSEELNGERNDIIIWSEDPAQFVMNALAPAVIESIILDEDKKAMEVLVLEENLAVAIGKGGQNVRLAVQLTDWKIDILTPQESANKQSNETNLLLQQFIDKLSISEETAQTLVNEGFQALEEVGYVNISELIDIFDEETAALLQKNARQVLNEEKIQAASEFENSELKDLEGMSLEIIRHLKSENIITLENLADLSTDELLDLFPKENFKEGNKAIAELKPSFSRATKWIMTAREQLNF